MSSITLLPVRRADGPDLVAANLASRDHHAPWVSPFIDLDGFDAYFAQTVTGATVGLVAREAESGGVVGVFTISQIALGNFKSAYLGYYGMAAFAGRGLMRDALEAVTVYAFNEIGLNRIEANIQPGNRRSIALVERCGFEKEGFSRRYLKIGGEWRDHERWAKLAP
ncbi:GNAT family N-acetyltransferase [Allorhizobium taibaishanense]|uniref:Phosphinothricin acetyltransferase n=1 Tax=Allorhizobium taibaishanense TaxID=887144 RepID=A0A1Q9A025_9HYPH|nr:GNAT family protein [Allorhizobium taibaishanense]MBB4007208.1 ribosomal-protein-alanine N-acetyltransferase [Allorhizobium taibaishanense]OLP47780.1 phosphinothricin acetyltransferase [Allorhizobium taibaishanense]